jgi:photosystem II stability/assembly factor-like uncharacterized protein
MKKLLYLIIYFFILFVIFRGFIIKTAGQFGIDIPFSQSLLVSNDGGENWKPINNKYNASADNIIFTSEDNLFLASSSGIFEVKDNEVKSKKGDVKKEISTANYIDEYIQDPNNNETVYAITRGASRSELIVSNDGGENFRRIYIASDVDKILSFKIHPNNSNILYIGTRNGIILQSQDYGTSWQKKKDFSRHPVTAIGINPENEEIFVATGKKAIDPFSFDPFIFEEKFNIYVSNDGGDNFKLWTNKLPKIKQIEFTDSQMYLVSDLKIYTTKNGSVSAINLITPTKNDKINAFTINPKNPNILYVGAGFLLYKSNNGGATWSVTQPPEKGTIKTIRINPFATESILISVAR